jgi:SHS2 domain-containing protein
LLFELEHRAAVVVEVRAFTSRRLEVVLASRLVDAERSVYYREVKAVTYHELAIREVPGGVEATVIVDI